MNEKYSPAWPHGKIKELFKNIFFVTGTNKIEHEGKMIQASRNMVVVREGLELTLINTVRLNDEALKYLNTLGKITNIIRLGAFHGRDDAFYRDQYGAKLWAIRGMEFNDNVDADIYYDSQLAIKPFSSASFLIFESTMFPEAVLHIAQEGGILVTCDSIKNWTQIDEYFSVETGQEFQAQGFIQPVNIDKVWLSAMKPSPNDLKGITSLTFNHLISAHGEPLKNKAFEPVSSAINSYGQMND